MAVIEINAGNFEQEVVQSDKPVLLDFWASWCGPCKMLSPVVDQVGEELDSVKVGKVNVNDESELAAKFGVASIPTLVVLKNGKEVNRSVGVVPKERILGLLD